MATVLPAGLIQFNDEPEGDGVSAGHKHAELTNWLLKAQGTSSLNLTPIFRLFRG